MEVHQGLRNAPKTSGILPNGRQQGGAFGAAPRERRFAPPPWGFGAFHLVRISYVFGAFPGPWWASTIPLGKLQPHTPPPLLDTPNSI